MFYYKDDIFIHDTIAVIIKGRCTKCALYNYFIKDSICVRWGRVVMSLSVRL